MRLTFSRAMPAMAATSLWLTFWRIRMRPWPTSWPNARARSSNARATRPFSGRKLPAATTASVSRSREASKVTRCRYTSGYCSAKVWNAARLTKVNSDSRTAETEAERGSPSMVASSPTMPPGPTIARMRSAPDAAVMLTFRSPCSTR